MDCKHLLRMTDATKPCTTCNGKVELRLWECAKYGLCTVRKPVEGLACCNGRPLTTGGYEPCPRFEPKEA